MLVLKLSNVDDGDDDGSRFPHPDLSVTRYNADTYEMTQPALIN